MALDTSLIRMAESIDDRKLSDRSKRIILDGEKASQRRVRIVKTKPDSSREVERSLSHDSRNSYDYNCDGYTLRI